MESLLSSGQHYSHRHPSQFTIIDVKVDGYSWRVYGGKVGARWHSHLVEFMGPYPAPRLINKALLECIRAEIASSLTIKPEIIKHITRDLVLV